MPNTANPQEIFVAFVDKIDRHTRALDDNTRVMSELIVRFRSLEEIIGSGVDTEEDSEGYPTTLMRGIGDLSELFVRHLEIASQYEEEGDEGDEDPNPNGDSSDLIPPEAEPSENDGKDRKKKPKDKPPEN